MGKIKKILCILLVCAMVIVPCSVLGSVSAQTDDTEPLTVEVTTDKSSYKTYDIAEITVKVANTSDETVNSIVAQARFDTLAPVGRDSVTYKEVESLQPGESFSFSYKATLNSKKFALMNFFEKIILWFVRLFNGGYTATEHDNPENLQYISQTTDIRFGGKYLAQNVVVVGYESIPFEEVTFSSIDSDKFDIDVGVETDVKFWVTVNSSSPIKDNEVPLYCGNEVVGMLNDNGINGDKTANDDVFSGTITVFRSKRELAEYYVKYNGVESFKTNLNFYEPPTETEDAIMENFEIEIDKIKEKYRLDIENSPNEEYALQKAEESYNEIVNYLENNPYVADWGFTGFNIMVKFNFNLMLGIELDSIMKEARGVAGVKAQLDSQEDNKWKIITLEPDANDLSTNVYDNAATKIANSFSNYSFSKDLDNSAVSVETLKNLADYRMIIINGHGGGIKTGFKCYVMAITESVTENKNQYFERCGDYGVNIIKNGNHYVISETFFNKYYSSGDFQNSFIFFSTCHSGDDSSKIKDILENKGAQVVLTYKNSVNEIYANQMAETIFDCLIQNKTISEAVEIAKKTHGEFDPYSKEAEKAELILSGHNKHFRLSSKETGTFSATVKNRSTDTPIEGVNVSIYLESEKDKADKNIYTYTTNEYGKIKATLPAGKYIAEFTNGMQKAQTTFTIEKDVNYVLQSPIYLDDNYWIVCNVTDTQGNTLQNVNVSVLNKGTGHKEYNVTANSGLSFTLSAGTYEITVSKDGYQSVTQTLIQPQNAINRVLNITLTATGEPDTPTDEPEDDTSKYGTLTETGSCGDNAFYDFYEETGTLVIRGTGAMTNWHNESSVPWYNKHLIFKTVIVNNGITSIGKCAFEDCYSITSITIPDSVTKIGERAFSDCDTLTNIMIPESVKSIGDYAFSFSESLSSITIPNAVTTIGAFAFRGCINLTTIQLGKNVTSIGLGAFLECYSLTNITVNQTNQHYLSDEYGVLFNKEKTVLIQYPTGNERKNYKIPDTVKNILQSAFYYCESLTNIQIGKSVTSIGNAAFENCSALTSITIPDSVSTIGHFAFQYCDSLTDVQIGKGVISIGNNAFSSCNSLSIITIPDNVTNIGVCAFSDCSSLTNIIVNDANKYYSSDEYGVLFNKDKTVLIQYPCGNKRNNYKIPCGVTTIGGHAFNHCSGLTSVTVSNSVTSIENCAFIDCNNLTSITISNSVTNIGESVFLHCNNLKNVYYTGTKEEWKKITIGENNEKLTNATIHYNS